jgi:hypothetical protein
LTGAALVTLVTSVLAALSLGVAVFRVCRIRPPAASMLRSGLVAAAAYGASMLWAASGPLVLLELGVLAAASVLALVVMGELKPAELAALRAWLRRERQPAT